MDLPLRLCPSPEMVLPTVNTKLFSLALGEFAKEVRAGKERSIVLVDKAG